MGKSNSHASFRALEQLLGLRGATAISRGIAENIHTVQGWKRRGVPRDRADAVRNLAEKCSAYLARTGSGPVTEDEILALSAARGGGQRTPSTGLEWATEKDTSETFIFVRELDVRLSAGGGTYIETENEARAFPFYREWWNRQINRNPGNVRLVHVDGDSMNPLLSDRDAVLIDTEDKAPKSGRVYAVLLEDGSAVKEIQVTPTHLEVWERFPIRMKIHQVERGDERAEKLIRGRVLYYRSGEGMFSRFSEIMRTIEQGFRDKWERDAS